MAFVIRPAVDSDWAFIEQWRDDHFAEMAYRQTAVRPVEGQRDLSSAVWIVCERDGQPTAATSYTDGTDTRFAHDLYAAPGCVIDGLRLGKFLERMCDDQGMILLATTDPENLQYIELLLKRGFAIASVELRRQPRKG